VISHSYRNLSKTVPVGFLSGGFTSTAGYVSGNEVRLSPDDFCYLENDQFSKRVRFYPNT
jgi:uncharacterized transporter YbjL